MKSLVNFLNPVNESMDFKSLRQTLVNILAKVDDEFDNAITVKIDKVHVNDSFMSHIAGYIIENVVHNALYTYKAGLEIDSIPEEVSQQKPYDFILDGKKIEVKARKAGANSFICTDNQLETKDEMIFCIISYNINGNKITIDADNIVVKEGKELKPVKQGSHSLTWK